MKKLFLALVTTAVFFAVTESVLACDCDKKKASKKAKSCACDTCGSCKDKKSDKKADQKEAK